MRCSEVQNLRFALIVGVLCSFLSFQVGHKAGSDGRAAGQRDGQPASTFFLDFLEDFWGTGSNDSWSGQGKWNRNQSGTGTASTLHAEWNLSHPPAKPDPVKAGHSQAAWPKPLAPFHFFAPGRKARPSQSRPQPSSAKTRRHRRRRTARSKPAGSAICPRWGPGHWSKCRAALSLKLGVGKTPCPSACVTFGRFGQFNNNVQQLANVYAHFVNPKRVPLQRRMSILLDPFWNATLGDMVDFDQLAKLCIFPSWQPAPTYQNARSGSWQQKGRLDTCRKVGGFEAFHGPIRRTTLPGWSAGVGRWYRDWGPGTADWGPFVSWIFVGAASERARREVWTLDPRPPTLNPQPSTLNHQPQTPNPKPPAPKQVDTQLAPLGAAFSALHARFTLKPKP